MMVGWYFTRLREFHATNREALKGFKFDCACQKNVGENVYKTEPCLYTCLVCWAKLQHLSNYILGRIKRYKGDVFQYCNFNVTQIIWGKLAVWREYSCIMVISACKLYVQKEEEKLWFVKHICIHFWVVRMYRV